MNTRQLALKVIRSDMRRYATQRRDPSELPLGGHGVVLGSLYMADALRAITLDDFDRLVRRLERIRGAPIGRRPRRPFPRLKAVAS